MTTTPVLPRMSTSVLAASEARLLTRMPALWAGFILTVALCAVWNGRTNPRWETFAANSGRAALVLAGFLVLIGHLAASRDHRHGAAEFTGTLPAPPPRRTVALLAFLPVAAAVGILAQGAELLVLVPVRLSGSFDPWLVAGPVVMPMAGAALGIAVGLWWPSTAAGPLTLFAAAAVLATLPILGSGPGDLPWLLFPIVLDGSAAPDATGWHVLYLVAMLAVVIAVALARHWRSWATIVVTIALIAAVAGVRGQQQAQPATGQAAAVSAALPPG